MSECKFLEMQQIGIERETGRQVPVSWRVYKWFCEHDPHCLMTQRP